MDRRTSPFRNQNTKYFLKTWTIRPYAPRKGICCCTYVTFANKMICVSSTLGKFFRQNRCIQRKEIAAKMIAVWLRGGDAIGKTPAVCIIQGTQNKTNKSQPVRRWCTRDIHHQPQSVGSSLTKLNDSSKHGCWVGIVND